MIGEHTQGLKKYKGVVTTIRDTIGEDSKPQASDEFNVTGFSLDHAKERVKRQYDHQFGPWPWRMLHEINLEFVEYIGPELQPLKSGVLQLEAVVNQETITRPVTIFTGNPRDFWNYRNAPTDQEYPFFQENGQPVVFGYDNGVYREGLIELEHPLIMAARLGKSKSDLVEDHSFPAEFVDSVAERLLIRCGTTTNQIGNPKIQYGPTPKDMLGDIQEEVEACGELGVHAIQYKPSNFIIMYVCDEHFPEVNEHLRRKYESEQATRSRELLFHDVVFPSRIHTTEWFRNIDLNLPGIEFDFRVKTYEYL